MQLANNTMAARRRSRTASIGPVAYGIAPPWPPSSAADACKNRTHMLYRQEVGGTGVASVRWRDGHIGVGWERCVGTCLIKGDGVCGGGGWGPQVRGAQDSPAPSHPNTSTSRPQEQPSGRPHHRMDHTPTPHFGRTVPPSATTPKPAVALGALTPLDGTRPYHRQYCLLRAGSRACLRVENVRCRTARRRSNSHGSEPVAKVHPARFVLYRAVWTPAFAWMTWLTCGGISLLRR